MEVSEFGYALDYHIAICFEIGDAVLFKEVVLKLVEDRFTKMKIELDTLLGTKPIAVLCSHNSSIWNGIVKIHMKFPQLGGTTMLTGVRPFILKLDESCILRGKVCKTFDNIAPPKLLSTRINREFLIGKSFYDIHYEIVDEGFKRDFKFEVTSVQKHLDQNFAWVRSTAPEEAINLRAQ